MDSHGVHVWVQGIKRVISCIINTVSGCICIYLFIVMIVSRDTT